MWPLSACIWKRFHDRLVLCSPLPPERQCQPVTLLVGRGSEWHNERQIMAGGVPSSWTARKHCIIVQASKVWLHIHGQQRNREGLGPDVCWVKIIMTTIEVDGTWPGPCVGSDPNRSQKYLEIPKQNENSRPSAGYGTKMCTPVFVKDNKNVLHQNLSEILTVLTELSVPESSLTQIRCYVWLVYA